MIGRLNARNRTILMEDIGFPSGNPSSEIVASTSKDRKKDKFPAGGLILRTPTPKEIEASGWNPASNIFGQIVLFSTLLYNLGLSDKIYKSPMITPPSIKKQMEEHKKMFNDLFAWFDPNEPASNVRNLIRAMYLNIKPETGGVLRKGDDEYGFYFTRSELQSLATKPKFLKDWKSFSTALILYYVRNPRFAMAKFGENSKQYKEAQEMQNRIDSYVDAEIEDRSSRDHQFLNTVKNTPDDAYSYLNDGMNVSGDDDNEYSLDRALQDSEDDIEDDGARQSQKRQQPTRTTPQSKIDTRDYRDMDELLRAVSPKERDRINRFGEAFYSALDKIYSAGHAKKVKQIISYAWGINRAMQDETQNATLAKLQDRIYTQAADDTVSDLNAETNAYCENVLQEHESQKPRDEEGNVKPQSVMPLLHNNAIKKLKRLQLDIKESGLKGGLTIENYFEYYQKNDPEFLKNFEATYRIPEGKFQPGGFKTWDEFCDYIYQPEKIKYTIDNLSGLRGGNSSSVRAGQAGFKAKNANARLERASTATEREIDKIKSAIDRYYDKYNAATKIFDQTDKEIDIVQNALKTEIDPDKIDELQDKLDSLRKLHKKANDQRASANHRINKYTQRLKEHESGEYVEGSDASKFKQDLEQRQETAQEIKNSAIETIRKENTKSDKIDELKKFIEEAEDENSDIEFIAPSYIDQIDYMLSNPDLRTELNQKYQDELEKLVSQKGRLTGKEFDKLENLVSILKASVRFKRKSKEFVYFVKILDQAIEAPNSEAIDEFKNEIDEIESSNDSEEKKKALDDFEERQKTPFLPKDAADNVTYQTVIPIVFGKQVEFDGQKKNKFDHDAETKNFIQFAFQFILYKMFEDDLDPKKSDQMGDTSDAIKKNIKTQVDKINVTQSDMKKYDFDVSSEKGFSGSPSHINVVLDEMTDEDIDEDSKYAKLYKKGGYLLYIQFDKNYKTLSSIFKSPSIRSNLLSSILNKLNDLLKKRDMYRMYLPSTSDIKYNEEVTVGNPGYSKDQPYLPSDATPEDIKKYNDQVWKVRNQSLKQRDPDKLSKKQRMMIQRALQDYQKAEKKEQEDKNSEK